jgi:hypothetical protein
MKQVLAVATTLLVAAQAPADDVIHSGVCDGSALVSLDQAHFALASDEDNRIRVYPAAGGDPVATLDLSTHFGVRGEGGEVEADLEGATRLGETSYWIGSHGRSKKGNYRAPRHVLFATRFERDGGVWRGRPYGQVYTGLAEDLSRHEKLVHLGLAESIRIDLKARADELRPKQAGLNVEGLATTPEGDLWIGLRNPLADGGRAIVVPMLNPEAVIGAGAAARYGDPILLDLDGLGIRSIEHAPSESGPGAYYLLAGPKSGGAIVLYRWSGSAREPAQRLGEVEGLNAEGLSATTDGRGLLLVSDDGSRLVGGAECKDLDPGRKRFRSRRVELGP